jgi:membrane protease YdiL (CAAX protease family)
MKQIVIVILKAALFLAFCIFILQIPRWSVLTETLAGKLSAAQSALWIQLLPPFLVLLVTFLAEAFVEKKQFLTRFSRRPSKDSFLGLLFGVIFVGATLGLLYVACDSFRLGPRNAVPEFYLWVIVAILNAVTQEYIARGYLFSLIQTNFGTVGSLVVSTLVFAAFSAGAMTGGVMAILVILTLGLLLSLIRLYTGGLLASIIVHAAWSACGSLVFGLLPQAGDGLPHLWNTSLTGIGIFTGGAMEMGGSLITLLVLAGVIDLQLIIMGDSPHLRVHLHPRRKKPSPPRAAQPAGKDSAAPSPKNTPECYMEPMPQPVPEPGISQDLSKPGPHLTSVSFGQTPNGAAVPDSVQSRK